jgi:hypothetical protein
MNPLGRDISQLGRAGRTHAEAGWAAPKIWPNIRILIRNSFSFSNLFYKLQINLTSTHTIKYKSTSSHQEKYAMV